MAVFLTEDELGVTLARPSGSILSVPENPIPNAMRRAGATMLGVGLEQKAKAEQVDDYAAATSMVDFEGRQRERTRQMITEMKPGADGLERAIEQDYLKQATQFSAGLPERLRESYAPKLAALKNDLLYGSRGAVPSAEIERLRVQNDKLTGTANSLLNRVAIETDPKRIQSATDASLADYRSIVETAPHLTPVQREEAYAKFKADVTNAELLQRIQVDPEGAKIALGGATPAMSPVDSLTNKIVGVESSGDPNAKNSRSTATGLGQFTEGTWLATLDSHRSDLAGLSRAEKLALRTDPKLSREMTAAHAQDNADFLAARGLPVTDGTLYLAHFAGAGGASKVLSASDDTPIEQVLTAGQLNANPFLREKGITTAGALKKWAADKMGSAPTSAPAIAGRYADISYDARQKALGLIEQKERERSADLRSSIDLVTDSAPAAIKANGVYDGAMPTTEQFVQAYGSVDGARRAAAFQSSLQAAGVMHDMRTMPAADIERRVSEAEGAISTGPMAGIQAKSADSIKSAADAVLVEREKDPGAYVASNFQKVAESWTKVDQARDPSLRQQAMGEAISRSVSAQQTLGIASEKVSPLPKSVVEQTVGAAMNGNLPEAERLAPVVGAVLASPRVEDRRAVVEQLVKGGLPDTSRAAFDAFARGDEAAGRRLLGAALVNPDNLPGGYGETKPKEIDAAISAVFMADGSVGSLYYGLENGGLDAQTQAARGANLAKNAVKLRVKQGEPLDAAVASVARDMFGDVKPVVVGDGLFGPAVRARFLAAADEDTDLIVDGLAAVKGDVETSLRETASAQIETVVTSNGARAIVKTSAENRIDGILEDGEFVELNGGFAFLDPFTGLPIPDATGAPIIFTPDRVKAAGRNTRRLDTVKSGDVPAGASPNPNTVPEAPAGRPASRSDEQMQEGIRSMEASQRRMAIAAGVEPDPEATPPAASVPSPAPAEPPASDFDSGMVYDALGNLLP